MSVRKWFGRDKDNGETYEEYSLATMKVGFMVDYDLRTWTVTGRQTYDFDGFITTEWELSQGRDVNFLERSETDGRVEWTITRRIEINRIEEAVIDYVLEHDDPPEAVTFAGNSYESVETNAGLMREDGEGDGKEFINWSYEGKEDRVIFITQWGERDFVAYEGTYAEEYQFTDILPGPEE